MLNVGDKAPDFTLLDQDGKSVSLTDFRGKVLLWFYPKASTPGCTAEGCNIRDHHAGFSPQMYRFWHEQGFREATEELATSKSFRTHFSRMRVVPPLTYGAWGQKVYGSRV